MQDVFVQVMRNEATFRGEASPATWLYRVTTNVCLNQIREHKRRATREQENPRPCLSRAPKNIETQLIVQQLLHRLSDDLAQVAVYYFVDRMNQAEIAALMLVSERTVRARLTEFQTLAHGLLTPSTEATS